VNTTVQAAVFSCTVTNCDCVSPVQILLRASVVACRDKPAIASDGEKISAYYNIACCLSRTGNIHDGLLALLEALQMGYEDFDQLRQDPDLEAIRADTKFEPLMQRFQKVTRQNMLQSFIGNLKNPLQR